MTVTQAKQAAKKWVLAQGEKLPGLVGAYLSGSLLEKPPQALLPAASDVDVVLVFSQGNCPKKLGKFQAEGVLLEGTCLEETEFSPLERVLSTHYLAFALQAGQILWDPQGRLGALHRQVAACYDREEWVHARVQALLDRVRQGLTGPLPQGYPQRINGWLFPTGITCFPLLVADLRNCTVRRRYAAARETLERRGLGEAYPRLLGLLVPEPLGRERLLPHLEALSESFSLAAESRGPSQDYPFRGDISPQGRAAALGGCRELLDSPWPEEAAFWMGATFARCQSILELDSPPTAARPLPYFQKFMEDLGIGGEEDLFRRREQVLQALPWVEGLAAEVARRRSLDFSRKTVDKSRRECYSEDVF